MRSAARTSIAATALSVLATGVGWTSTAADAAALDLHRGSRGVVVRTLEQRLNTLGLLPRRAVDRRYGRRTTSAVRAFQRGHGLPVTGRVRTADWDAVAAAVAPAPPPPWTAPAWAPPTIVAHRGTGIGTPPENSLAAWALAAPVADVLEMDVRWTSDHQMVVLHDPTLDRTTTCTGEVSAWTAADLATSCRLADGSPVPTFDDAVRYAASTGLRLAPEIKTANLPREDLAAFVAVLQAHHVDGLTDVQSFYPDYFATLASLDAKLRFVHLDLVRPLPTAEQVRASGAQVVAAPLGLVDAAQVAAWRRSGLQVWLWTSRDLPTLQQTWTLRADAAVTDVAAAARDLYGSPR